MDHIRNRKRDWHFGSGEPQDAKRGRLNEQLRDAIAPHLGGNKYSVEEEASSWASINDLHSQSTALADTNADNCAFSSPGQPDCARQPHASALPIQTTVLNSDQGGFLDEICLYGTTSDVQAQLLTKNAAEDPYMHLYNEFYYLEVSVQRNHVLRDANGTDIAVLDRKTSNALKQLEASFQMQYSAYISVEQWEQCAGSSRSTAQAAIADVELNISGPRGAGREAGKLLSRAKIYLQHPRFQPTDMPYENPHFIILTDVGAALPEIQRPDMTLQPVQGSIAELQSVDSIFDGMDQHMHLRQAQSDDNIITAELQAHQKTAVDFIAQRESVNMPEAFRMWKYTTNEDMRLYFQHSVLGRKKPFRPNENFGGIIADEMGLGKTLSMLSAIVLSLQCAKAFAASRPQKTAKPPSRATLIVVPSALLMDVWEGEICRHMVSGSLKCEKFHGQGRNSNVLNLANNDIVITTYATISSEYLRGSSTLHQIMWYRIVLDEAHSICRQTTKRFSAISSIDAQHRWCLTGTPIQNRLDDIGALVSFLRVPYLDSVAWFRSNIVTPVECGSEEGISKLKSLLECICLRRTKQVIHLPGVSEETRVLHLTAEERSQYENITIQHRREIEHAVSTTNTMNASSGLCLIILRLRLFCNHGLPAPRHKNSTTPPLHDMDEEFSLAEQTGQISCANCTERIDSLSDTENPRSGIYTTCTHLLCSNCVNQESKSSNDTLFICPVCNTLTSISTTYAPTPAPTSSPVPPSTKLKALLTDLLATPPSEKSIVFTTWTHTLRLTIALLSAHSIPHTVIHGALPPAARLAALDRFHSPETSVLLMTIGTGSVGLNLTAANRIYILEPQWNPAAESQAVGRALRLGQKKRVVVVRYVVADTVEEHIVTRQKKKVGLSRVALGAGDHEGRGMIEEA